MPHGSVGLCCGFSQVLELALLLECPTNAGIVALLSSTLLVQLLISSMLVNTAFAFLATRLALLLLLLLACSA